MWHPWKEKKTKKGELLRPSFERQMYIPKKTLQKKERLVPVKIGKTRTPVQGTTSWIRKGIIIFLWSIFIGEVVYIVFFARFFIPHTINITTVPPELAVESFIQEQFTGKYGEIIPKNNLLLLSPQELEQRLRERFPRFEEVSVKKILPETILVDVQLLPYQILWCKGQQCLLLTKEGTLTNADIFFQYPQEQGVVEKIRDESGRELSPQSKVLTQEEVNFVEAVIRDFNSRTGLEKEGDFVRPSIYTQEIRIHTTKGFWVYLSTQQDLGQTLDNLVLFLQKEVPAEEWGQLDYVDLRTENRVYYTRKDRQPENLKEPQDQEEGSVINTSPFSGT
jgi:cell division septal protein FtsQ